MDDINDLKAAFRRSCIWRMGWTFERAMSVPSIATSIRMSALAHRRKHHSTSRRPHETLFPRNPACIFTNSA